MSVDCCQNASHVFSIKISIHPLLGYPGTHLAYNEGLVYLNQCFRGLELCYILKLGNAEQRLVITTSR